MTINEHDAIKQQGHGRGECGTCRAITDFTHDEQGEIFCVSCGNRPTITADVVVENFGSIFTFAPMSQAAKDWIEENVQDGAQWFGGSLVVEHRFVRELARGMADDGLTLQ